MSHLFAQENRFPHIERASDNEEGQFNPAIQLYGRRYFKDQSTVEYLSEMLLVFLSPKGEQSLGSQDREHRILGSFAIDGKQQGIYWPKANIALKLFSFFAGSKLDTRHASHKEAYLNALHALKDNLSMPDAEKDSVIALLQSLLNGFVGISKNRTWVAQTFLPISPELISREVGWRQTDAKRSNAGNEDFTDWSLALPHFNTASHMFMARGGESLFLQLANLFSLEDEELHTCFETRGCTIPAKTSLAELQNSIEVNLNKLLTEAVKPLNDVIRFVENSLQVATTTDDGVNLEQKKAKLGWVPKSSAPEAFLFAIELNNILTSNLPELEKLDILQTLCSMQVLRNLCCQAYRIEDENGSGLSFVGQYIWVTADPSADPANTIRKLSQNSLTQVEQVLFRVLKTTENYLVTHKGAVPYAKPKSKNMVEEKDAQKHGFGIFRKVAKDIDLVIPLTGSGQRFVLTPKLIRFLVVALIAPGEQMTLNDFYERVFAHYGIALGDQQLAKAIEWLGGNKESQQYAITASTNWIEEALQQGGFLLELSDAVSIVRNTIGME